MDSAFHLNGNTICLSPSLFFFLRGKEDTTTRDECPFSRFYAGLLCGVLSSTEKALIHYESVELPCHLLSIHAHSRSQNKLAGCESLN